MIEYNIYGFKLNDEMDICELITSAIDSAVVSLYVILIARENLLDKLMNGLKEYKVITKHKYIFVNQNLPMIAKLNSDIDTIDKLIDIKFNYPFLNECVYEYQNKVNSYIITINCSNELMSILDLD